MIVEIQVKSPVNPEEPQVFKIRVPYGELNQPSALLEEGQPEDVAQLILMLQETQTLEESAKRAEMKIRAAGAEMFDLLPLDVYERVVKRLAAAVTE